MTDSTIPIIDTHQHLWVRSVLDLEWTKGAGSLDDDFPIERYAREAAGRGVAKTIYMEVNCRLEQQQCEVDYVVGLCARDDNPMCAVIAGGDPASPDFADFAHVLADDRYVVGTRRVLHNNDKPPGSCLEPAFVANVQMLGELGLTFDLCLRPAELADGIELVDRCPQTTFIVDHCGNADPYVVNGQESAEPGSTYAHDAGQWRDDMQALAAQTNVYCKISGIIARVRQDWQVTDLAPTVDHCLDRFGPERVIFGGDWPVCTLGAPLADWIVALRQIISHRSTDDQRKLFYDNAARLFGLE